MEVVLTLVIITTEALNVFVLSFTWQMTGVIAGRRRSVAVLAQMLPTALTSCMSSLVFLPYMARFPSSYISAHHVGNGIGSLVPGMIGLVQYAAGDPADCVSNGTQITNDTLRNVTVSTLYGMANATAASVIDRSQKPRFSVKIFFLCPVSYTHLTLPTIYSV